MSKVNRTAFLLRLLSKFVAESSEEDLASLEDGSGRLFILRTPPERKRTPSKRSAPTTNGEVLDVLIDRLGQQDSRDDGLRVILEAGLTRKGLESLARKLHVPVMADDNLARLQGRIVEAIVGARLNSKAIRGE